MWSLFKTLNSLLSAIRENTLALRALRLKVEELLERLRNLPDPDPISLTIVSEDGSMLNFKINLPALPPEPNDIASGELTVTVGSGEPQVIATAKEQVEVVGLAGNEGEAVNASFVYIDDAGNRSANASVMPTVVLADNIPPADPSVLALEITGES